MNVKKCILLSRVSTQNQSLDDQTRQLREEAHRLGYDDNSIIVIEDKESGIKLREEERHGLNELKHAIASNKDVNCVICWEISRIARRQAVLYSIRDYLLDAHIQLIILQPYLRLIDHNGNLDNNASIIFSLFGTLSEQEMTLKRERFKRAKDAMKLQGKWTQGPIMYGYRKNKDKCLEIDEEQAEVVRDIFNMYAKGNVSLISIYENYMTLGIFEHVHRTVGISRVRAMIRHLGYSGRHKLSYPAIVTAELQDKCIEIMKEKPKAFRQKTHNIYYAKSICICADCGKTMTVNSNMNIYRCSGQYHEKGDRLLHVNVNVLDSIAWMTARVAANIKMSISKNNTVLEYNNKIEENEKRIKAIKNMTVNLEAKLSRAFKLYMDGKVSDSIYEAETSKVNDELSRLNKEIEALETQINQYRHLINDDMIVADKSKDIGMISDDKERRDIITSLIDKIVVERGEDEDVIMRIEYKDGLIVPDPDEYFIYRRRGHKMMLFRVNYGEEQDISDMIVKRYENNSWRKDHQKR